MRHFVSACLVGHTFWEKNISKFVLKNSRFQIAEAFQFLLCDGRAVAVVIGFRSGFSQCVNYMRFNEK